MASRPAPRPAAPAPVLPLALFRVRSFSLANLAIAFFMAVLPQFVDLRAGSVPLQMFVLGVIVVVIGVICDSVWVLASSAARAWFARSPRRLEAMSATGGGLMIGLAGFLLIWSEKPATA